MKRSNRLSYGPVNLRNFTGDFSNYPIEGGATGTGPALDRSQLPGRMVTLPAARVTSITLRDWEDCSTRASRDPAATSWEIV